MGGFKGHSGRLAYRSYVQQLDTKDEFDQYLSLAQENLVIVFFNASWCGASLKMQTVIEKLEREYREKCFFCTVNIEKNT
jgi:thioredoxin-like negative regulator of GroEL